MMVTTIARSWADYELLDTGNGQRLERFGPHILQRPDPNVLWAPTHAERWQPDALFDKAGWQFSSSNLAQGWPIKFEGLAFLIKPTPFRHVGLFPEQQPNWLWLQEYLTAHPRAKVLNLFGYTGAASLVAAAAGAQVCHVDASRGSLRWAQENQQRSELPATAIRWIEDDAMKFMAREVRRGQKYDLIMMDPPVFGRGPKGEIFRLEERLSSLCTLAQQLRRDDSSAVLLNFYATSLYPESIARLAESILGKLTLHSLEIEEKWSEKRLPTGFFLRS